MAVSEINEAGFDAFIKSKTIVMVDCWAPWCGPCRRMGPVVDEISEKVGDNVAVGKLNTDENQGVAMKYGINAIPTLLFFKDGEQKDSLVGLRPAEDIIAYINSL